MNTINQPGTGQSEKKRFFQTKPKKGTDKTVRAFHRTMQVIKNIGAGNRSRTCDPLITNQMLYQLSYAGDPSIVQNFSAQLESEMPTALWSRST